MRWLLQRSLGAPLSHCRSAAWGLLVSCVLTACTAAPPEQDVTIGLRNPTAAFGGTSRFDPARFTGNWQAVACLGQCDRAVTYSMAADGVYLRETGQAQARYSISAPGVLREMGGDATLVVMWVDEGFRTAAVGDADGRWAAILNRTRTPARDRMRAATGILDFNGWDVSKLQVVQ